MALNLYFAIRLYNAIHNYLKGHLRHVAFALGDKSGRITV
jgi:hypothetical protein